MYVSLVKGRLSRLSQAVVIDYDVDTKMIGAGTRTAAVAAWVRALNTAADADDFPPARCDARENGPIALGD